MLCQHSGSSSRVFLDGRIDQQRAAFERCNADGMGATILESNTHPPVNIRVDTNVVFSFKKKEKQQPALPVINNTIGIVSCLLYYSLATRNP
mmetsp:Transcript_13462/g.25346  ORF Transcript_13462/g.25346 Transcript_13462/m.25346 type:complete len:92 (+) Transcript_13462:259-534(+)